MEVYLVSPEEVLVGVDDEYTPETCYMYIIQKGDCQVTVKDNINEITEEIIVKQLNPGDHFGVTCFY